jgi:hypothetical protein
MGLISKQKLVLASISCLLAMFCTFGTLAIAESSIGGRILHPQGIEHAGIYDLRKIDPSLTGSNIKFAVVCRSFTYIEDEPQNDYRPNIEHNCFKNSQIIFSEQTDLFAGTSPHSTAICSILLGEDSEAYNSNIGKFYYQGIAPQAQAEIFEFWNFVINNIFNNSPPDADIITASIGSHFEDWWTRGIESLAEHYGLIIVAGIGNGADSSDPVLYPGACANVIGVGVIDSVNSDDAVTNLSNFALAYPEHSSFGPTANGCCKPDIIAPGNCLAADINQPNRYEPTGNWSSFSTPIVAGTIGLLIQKANQDPELKSAVLHKGGNCVIKAILLNSATKLPYWHKGKLQINDDHIAPLDYIQGAGMLNAVGAYEQLVAGMKQPGDVSEIGWDLNTLDKSQTLENIYKITLTEPSEKYITATLVWNRHYNNLYPFESIPEKDSNLQLEIWAVDPDNQDNNYLLDYSDSNVDNIEHIYTAADPGYTNYEIIISFSDINGQEDLSETQRYGLAWKINDKQDNDNIFWYDLCADGIVNESDLTILLNNLSNSNKSPESYLLGDINTDGAIDVNDLKILLNHNNRLADWRIE